MKKEVVPQVLIPQVTFPTELVPDSEKKTMDFGLQIGTSIQYEWFWKQGASCRYYSQLDEYRRLRLYARGEQPIQKYKNELAVDGDLSHLNLDWTPVPILPKFVDIVVNGMSDRLFKVKAYAQDAMSQAKRSKYQDMIEGQMVAKPVLSQIQELTGINPFVMNPDELPNTDEELSLYMQLNFKPAIEIAEEEAINTLFEENHWADIRRRVDYDQTTLGVGVAKHEFQAGTGVVLSYVDPEYWISSYTEDPMYRDCFYFGEIKTIPLTELYKIKPNITKEEIKQIALQSQAWYDYYNLNIYYDNSMYRDETVSLLYYNYKTSKKIVYKRKINDSGNVRMSKKDDTFNPSIEMMEEGGYEKVEKVIDVWYDGIMVLGSSIILKWEESKNMVRPQSSVQHALPNYVACSPRMYKGVRESLVRRMIPFADLIQITHLKIQQVLARVVPDGFYIDAAAIVDIDLGTGGTYNPNDALRLLMQTGSVIGRSTTSDGEFNHGKIPIQELNHSSGANKLQMLISTYLHYLDMIRSVTGLNEARDGSNPDPNALVGVQKLAALNSNTATRHILDASLAIFRGMAEALTYRVADLLEYSDFKDGFANRIGKYNVSILNEIKDLYMYDFGIYIEVSPDEEEKAQLEANIQMALSKQDISLSDAIDIREIKNIKLANQLLKLKKAKNDEREEKMEMQKQAMIAQQQLKSQEMASQTALQKIQLETESKMRIIQEQAAADIAKIEREAKLKSGLMREEFDYNIQLNGMTEDKIIERDKMKEDRKDARTDLQASQQSELITQRSNNLPPKRFESVNNDTMSDISFSDVNVENR
jgi:hypothetical protein